MGKMLKALLTINIVFLITTGVVRAENNYAERWLAAHFGAGAVPPFSFKYAGKPSELSIKDWEFSQQSRQLDDARTEHTYTYTDALTNLQVRVECILFKDFPAIEWVVKFKNNDKKDTPIIEDIKALDAAFAGNKKGNIVLHHALGSSATRDDFAPIDEVMKPNREIRLSPIGGRSSDVTAFPFFNIEGVVDGGVMVGIGWSGHWAASLVNDGDKALRVHAGMALTHLKLHPDEEIRTPRILLLFWQGDDYLVGHNMFRQFILAHHTPKKDGKPVTLPFSFSVHGVIPFNEITEQNVIDLIELSMTKIPVGFEYLWIDTGWFVGGWPNGVGNWFVDRARFPNGLKPISDAAKKGRMGFLLWVEPERVYRGTWLDREHPQWVLKHLFDFDTGLLNLGNDKALAWLTDHISNIIENEGINVYRQDFNMDPLPYWKWADRKDRQRQGITEIRYIEGLYAFWDELLRRHPNLIIDNCASGGRRIDLETISRSVALWRTDYQPFEPNGYQSHTYGISLYLPTTSIGSDSLDLYTFRSAMNNGIVVAWNPYQKDFPIEQARRLAEEFKSVRKFFFGDYYPLTPYSTTDDTWMAYQFHRTDLREGMVLAFRRHKCPTPTALLKLKGLLPTARYELKFEDSGARQVFTGKELAEGLKVMMESAPGSILITYRQLL